MKKIATSLDDDMRWRTSYNMATETGRLSSSKSAFGTGDNTQILSVMTKTKLLAGCRAFARCSSQTAVTS